MTSEKIINHLLGALPEPTALINGYGDLIDLNNSFRKLLPVGENPKKLSDVLVETSNFWINDWLNISCATRNVVPITLSFIHDFSLKYRVEATLVTAATQRKDVVLMVRLVDFDEKARKYATLNLRVFSLQGEVAKLRHQEHELSEAVHLDPLTKLLNRNGFYQEIKNKIKQQSSTSKPLCALIMADMDDLKTINDTFGHVVGDGVLVLTGQRFRELTQPDDLLVRYGGDEFLIYSSTDEFKEICTKARNIQQYFDQNNMVLQENSLRVTLSMGIKVFTPEELSQTTIEGILDHTDKALYHSKKLGRNRISIYRSDATSGAELLL